MTESTGGAPGPADLPLGGLPPDALPLDALPSDALPPRDQLDPDQKVAFGRYVKTELYDVFGDYDLASLTEAEKAWIEPDNISPMLFTAPANAKMQHNRLALNPLEYRILTRHPGQFARTVFARTLEADELDADRLEAARRSVGHAFEQKRSAAIHHLSDMTVRRADINRLRSEAHAPGYAHKKPQEMKQLIASSWQEFQGILDVLQIQRGWKDDRRQRAEAALVNYLTQGPQNVRVGHWKEMLELSDKYLEARISLFRAQTKKISRS